MEITTVIGCRNMCRYCPQALLINEYHRHSNDRVMTFNTFKACLNKIPKDVRIDFSGMAEPWLNKDCTKMLLYAHKQGFKHIAVFTTCMGMTEKDLMAIWQIPFDVFFLHLADKDRNSKIEVTDKYLKLLELINKLDIKNKRYMTMGKLHPKLKATFSPLVEEIKMISRAGNLESDYAINKTGRIKCCWPENLKHNGLLPNGDILLCSMDYGMTRVIGNLLTDSYDNLFKGRAFKQIQKLLDDPNRGDLICRHCEYATER